MTLTDVSTTRAQGPREGWAEGALVPPLFGAKKKFYIKKEIKIKKKLENSLFSD